MPAQFRSSILLVSRSCSVFPTRESTRIGHWNLIPVPILLTLETLLEPSTGISGNVSQISRIPGRTPAAITYVSDIVLGSCTRF